MNTKDSFFFFILAIFILGACGPTQVIKQTVSSNQINTVRKSENIRIHLKSGEFYVLNHWKIDSLQDTIRGSGRHYSRDRNSFTEKKWIDYPGYPDREFADLYRIAVKDVVLIETSKIMHHYGKLAAILVVGVPMGILSIYCIINPKACFGSCPTFYGIKEGKWMLMAEGFSSSIFPAFEKKDIDMLYELDDQEDTLSLKLTNEALETHVIRYVDLLAFPKTEGEMVYATEEGSFYRTTGQMQPSECMAEEGSCLNLITKFDHKERYSTADSSDLSEKEEILVTFDKVPFKNPALVISSKQTLLTTYLFYEGMALSGNKYGDLTASLESGNKYLKNCIQKLWDKLGGIEIMIREGKNNWKKINEIREMGPITSDVHLVRLPETGSGKTEIKLKMTKGLWRIDHLSLVDIIGEDSPVRISPSVVLKDDTPDAETLSRLICQNDPLVTFPGDQYLLKYPVPDSCSYKFFMETKGYYLEWMREEWLAEENLKKLFISFTFPGWFMRNEAPEYKNVESSMEKSFWESRYVKN